MSSKYFLGIDCEMTGLDFDGPDYIIEIGAILLDENLNELERYASVRDDLPANVVQADTGTPYVLDMHERSGLFDAIDAAYRPNQPEVWTVRIDRAVQGMIQRQVKDAKIPVHLLGDSVHFDRNFLRAAGCQFERRLHHRHADCSSLRLNAPIMPKEESGTRHRAISDVEFSILTWGTYQDVLSRFLP